jgi:integrase
MEAIMGRRKTLAPKMYPHIASGQWAVNLATRRVYLGKDRGAAEAKYREVVAEYLASGAAAAAPAPKAKPAPAPAAAVTVTDAARQYALGRKPLVSEAQYKHYLTVLGHLGTLFEGVPARDFGASHMRRLKEYMLGLKVNWREGSCVRLVREALASGPRPSAEVERLAVGAGHARSVYRQARKALGVESRREGKTWLSWLPPGGGAPPEEKPLSRKYVSSLLGIVRTMWKRLASEGHVSQQAAAEVQGVLNPEPGQGRETEGRLPPPSGHVEKVLEVLSPAGPKAVLALHRTTGARPGELCSLRRADVSTGPDDPVTVSIKGRKVSVVAPPGCWLYAPAAHKTRKRGKPRVILLGPKSIEALRPHLESGFGVTASGYRQAVRRACERAGVPVWTPYQIRHAFATAKAATVNMEDLMAQLGHSDAATTSLYVAELIGRAARLAE